MENSMKFKKWIAASLPVFVITGALAAEKPDLTSVPTANGRSAAVASSNILSPELIETIVAQGSDKLENPSGLTNHYGYDNDGTMIPTGSPATEATKSEPDKNTYLVLSGMHGADSLYDYGRHFLYQGRESGSQDGVAANRGKAAGGPEKGYITRINLDADAAHRVTLMATTDSLGAPLHLFDGSMWYPFSRKLLFSDEFGAPAGGVWQMSPDFSLTSTVEDISGALGRGGYEGIQSDDRGNLILVEDVGGVSGSSTAGLTHAKQPNSFIYRFIPNQPSDLKLGGRLQVLQILSLSTPSHPMVFHSGEADADILSQDVRDLHTYGKTFATKWITIHDTSVDGFSPFDANALAKARLGTPLKRPENGQFRPRSGFSEFFFAETGDTNALTEAGAAYGGFGGVFRLRTDSGDTGSISLFYLGDVNHSGFDNTAFWTEDSIVVVEDAGDTLHGQRNGLDSAFLFNLHTDYSIPGNPPVRILAQGRDVSATTDSLFAFPYNDSDNEITGWHVSDGDPTIHGLIGTKRPTPFEDGWRVFYTQQHGNNTTWEILAKDRDGKKDKDHDDDRD
jgi:hypothetical protein